MNLLDLDPHLDPQLSVEVGQGFVEQKDLGVAHDRLSRNHLGRGSRTYVVFDGRQPRFGRRDPATEASDYCGAHMSTRATDPHGATLPQRAFSSV